MTVYRSTKNPDDTTHRDTPASIPNNIVIGDPIPLIRTIIQPGSSVLVPIIVTRSEGLTELLGLITFASAEDENDITGLRLELGFDVQPLVRINASVRPVMGDCSKYLVEVEVTQTDCVLVGTDSFRPSTHPSRISALQISNLSALVGFPQYRWHCELCLPQSHFSLRGAPSSVPAVLLPNQVSRTFVPLAADRKALATLDLLQHDTVASLTRLVQGQAEIDCSRERNPVVLVGRNFSAPSVLSSYFASKQSHRLQSLQQHFYSVSSGTLQRIFPLLDPLDLDLVISWFIQSTGRQGYAFLHSLRLAPEFSIVEGVRREIDAAVASGGKQTRTMYEETGRLRRVLVDSVLQGMLAIEEDPVVVRVKIGGRRRLGSVKHNFSTG